MPPGQAKTSPKTIAGRDNSRETKSVGTLGSKPNRITDCTPTPSGSHSESFSVRRIRSEATTGCGQEAAEPTAAAEAEATAGSESIEEVVEEFRALAAEVEALEEQWAEGSLLGQADMGRAYAEVERRAVVSDVEEAVGSGDWEQLRARWRAAHITAPARGAASPLELVQWVRDSFRRDRDSLRDRLSGP